MTERLDKWVQLEQPRLGSQVTFATDEFFGAKDRLIDPADPVFVEDLVRNVALRCKKDPSISWFRVCAENFESIHNHSAFAEIEWGEARP